LLGKYYNNNNNQTTTTTNNMVCSESTCKGGGICSTPTTSTDSTCQCPYPFTHQFYVKIDCSTPIYLLEITAILQILLSIFMLFRAYKLYPKARGLSFNAVRALIFYATTSMIVWIIVLVENGFNTFSSAFYILFNMSVFISTFYTMQIIILPSFSLKPSMQHKVKNNLLVLLITAFLVTSSTFLAASIEMSQDNIENANFVFILQMSAQVVFGVICCLIIIKGTRDLQQMLGGESLHQSSSPTNVRTVNDIVAAATPSHESGSSIINRTSRQAQQQQQQNTSTTTVHNSRAHAIERLDKIKQMVSKLAIGNVGPLAFVFCYFAIGRVPGYDFYIALFHTNLSLLMWYSVEQFVPKKQDGNNNIGNGNNNDVVDVTNTPVSHDGLSNGTHNRNNNVAPSVVSGE
jgi:hypothetical protein